MEYIEGHLNWDIFQHLMRKSMVYRGPPPPLPRIKLYLKTTTYMASIDALPVHF